MRLMSELPEDSFSHSFVVTLSESQTSSSPSRLGVTLSCINGVALVTAVVKGSEAERCGMAVGSIIASLDSVSVTVSSSGYEAVLRQLQEKRPLRVGLKLLVVTPGSDIYWAGIALLYERDECRIPRQRYCRLAGTPPRLEWWESAAKRFSIGVLPLEAECAHARRDGMDAPIAMLTVDDADSPRNLSFTTVASARTYCFTPLTHEALVEAAAAFGLLARCGGGGATACKAPKPAVLRLAPWDVSVPTLAEGFVWLRDAERSSAQEDAKPQSHSTWRRSWTLLLADGRLVELVGPHAYAARRTGTRIVLTGGRLLGSDDVNVGCSTAEDLPTSVAAAAAAVGSTASTKASRAAWKTLAFLRTFNVRTGSRFFTLLVEDESRRVEFERALKLLLLNPDRACMIFIYFDRMYD